MKILIVDDEELFINQIKEDLSNYFQNKNIEVDFDTCTENFQMLCRIEDYDYVIFDIELNNENGIELARRLGKMNQRVKFIFASAHSHLVFDTFVVTPFYFLRKTQYQQDLQRLYQLLDKEIKKNKLITLSSQTKKKIISIHSIIYIESFVHQLHIVCRDGIYYDSSPLNKFLNELPQYQFVQIHKSYVINLDYLSHIQSQSVTLAEDFHLPIGRKYKNAFHHAYQEYLML